MFQGSYRGYGSTKEWKLLWLQSLLFYAVYGKSRTKGKVHLASLWVYITSFLFFFFWMAPLSTKDSLPRGRVTDGPRPTRWQPTNSLHKGTGMSQVRRMNLDLTNGFFRSGFVQVGSISLFRVCPALRSVWARTGRIKLGTIWECSYSDMYYF